MSAPTPRQLALGAGTIVLILGGIIAGQIVPKHNSPLHARVDWPGEPPADVDCARILAVGPSEVWSLLGLDATERDMAVGYVCSDQSQDPPEVTLPPSIWLVDSEIVPYAPGMAQLEVWSARSPDAPAVCACAPLEPEPGAEPCEWLRPTIDGADEWVPAPARTNLDPGRWRGACIPKPACIDALGPGSSLPCACGGACEAPAEESP